MFAVSSRTMFYSMGVPLMKLVSFSLKQGSKYYGNVDNGPTFFIGSRVSYRDGKGLMNLSGDDPKQRYDRNVFRGKYGFWADFIHPTAMSEGALFHTLNTYDRARFTFSFLQFAAHVPDGDFVIYLRRLLALPLAAEYFPDLKLVNGRVHRVRDGVEAALESATTTEPLLDYFNPTLKEIEDTEVIQAARLIHWVQNDVAHRELQIEVGIKIFKNAMFHYAKRYALDGTKDVVCLIIADIRHQGRARDPEIIHALSESDPISALLKIGDSQYPDRIKVLVKEIHDLREDGTLGKRIYNLATRDFVLI
ncbi:hypothetical protein AWB68_07870 [Caballeronia choica]|uniref:Uncharacterized protein n=1 Tax=Caballeronia choica TaxID=326476 RepID=A0A158KZ14_9BURK|nr:hypothetical protein [Caballeronia choica]SAL85989.1 hypothetical protein AWB68_07870 [Caballeronia choica]